jgi:hypothetical protein
MTNRTYRKVAADMTLVQLQWAVWFFVITGLVYFVLHMLGGTGKIFDQDLNEMNFLGYMLQPSKIFMLVLGIISVSGFLPFYVRHGVTRKSYFIGGAISAIVLSLLLMLAASLTALLEAFFAATSLTGPWTIEAATFSLNLLFYFAAGWMISAGFYRDALAGIFFIALAVALGIINDMFHTLNGGMGLGRLLQHLIPIDMEVPLAVSFLGTILLIVFMMGTVRYLTKRIRVKLK